MPAVARGDDRRAALSPGGDDAFDRGRVELGPVCEHDDRGLHVRVERGQPAPERGAGPALPVRAGDGALELVRTRDDDDLIDSGEPLEHGGKEQALLRRAEPRRGTGREDDRRDQDSCTVTFLITTGFDGGPSPTPSASIALTVAIPSVTRPTMAYSGGSPMSLPVTTKNWLPAVPGASFCVFAIATTPSVYAASLGGTSTVE